MSARARGLCALLGSCALWAAVTATPAGAQLSGRDTSSARDGQDRPWAWADLGLKGALLYKGFAHVDEAPRENRRFRHEGILELEWERRLADWLRLRLVGDARVDDDELADDVHFQISETTKRRSVLNAREVVLRLGRGGVELGLGRQIYSWGTADAVNPTDSLNPYDFLDPLDRKKLGVWSAAYTLASGPVTHTIVVVPVFTPSRDQLSRSRWALQAPEGRVGVLDDREVPDGDTLQWATRLKVTLAGVDVSASYYDGYDNTPVLREGTAPVGPVTVPRFTPVYSRIRAAGADFSTTWRKFELHGEAAYKTIESRGRDDRLQWVVGANYAFDELPVRWLERVETVLEYSRENVLAKAEHSQYGPSIGFFGLAFGNALTGRVRVRFSEETQLAVSATVNFASGPPSHYTQVKLARKVTDAFHVEGGLDLLAGPTHTVWGQWRRNDRAFLELKYFF